MKGIPNRLLSLILALVIIFSMSITAFAAEQTQADETGEVVSNENNEEINQEKDLAEVGATDATTATDATKATEPVMLPTPKIKSITSGSSGITISWDKVEGATTYIRYQIFRYDEAKKGWKKLALTGKYSYTWTEGVPGTKYTFTLRCVNEDGSWASSYDNVGTSHVFYLDTPKILKVEDAYKGVTIIWGKVTGATTYRVFYKVGTSWKKIADTKATSYNFTSPEFNAATVYTVRCVNETTGVWESDYDKTGYSYHFGVATPKITNVVVNDAKGTLDIYWGKIAGMPSNGYYRVFFQNGDSWTAIGETDATSYEWKGFVAGRTYVFTVRCTNNTGNFISDFDEKGYSYTIKISTPKVNDVVKSTTATNAVKISWSGVAGAYKYRVFYKTSTSWKKIADTSSTSYTWTGAVIGQAYTYTVRCVNESDKFSSDYDPKGYTYTLYLDTPKISSISTVDTKSVKISWGKIMGAAKYRVFYQDGGSWKTIATTTGTSYTWTSPEVGRKYIYTVRCMSSDGKLWTSDYDKTGYEYKVMLSTPKITACTPTANNKFKISWDKVAGASKYRVFYYINSGQYYKKLGDTTNTSFNVTEAAIGATYRLTVRCVSDDGSTWQSDYIKEGFEYKFMLDTPKLSSITPQGGSKVKFSWGAVTGAIKYQLFYKDGTSWKHFASSTSTSYTWSGAEVNKEYIFTIRCVNSDGSQYQSSYDSNGVKYKHQLLTPQISSITKLSDDTVRITWGAITGAIAYKVFIKSGKSWQTIGITTETKFTWDDCEKGKTFVYTVRCIDEEGNYTSSYDSAGYPYIIVDGSSEIAAVALNELNYWTTGMHGYSSQGSKYWTDLGRGPADWCGYFATYCAKKAGISMFQNNKNIFGYVGAWKEWGQENGQWYAMGSKYIPSPGDMVIWGYGSYNAHVTVVVSVDQNKHTFYDVGGNEMYDSFYQSIVKKDGPFNYLGDSSGSQSILGFVGTHVLG